MPPRHPLRRWLAGLALAVLITAPHAQQQADADLDRQVLLEWGGTLAVCLLAGAVMWLRDVRRGQRGARSWLAFIARLSGAALAGLLVFLLCKSRGTDPYLAGALSGAAGMLGADWVRSALMARLGRAIGLPVDSGPVPLDRRD